MHFIRGTDGARIPTDGVFLTPPEWDQLMVVDGELDVVLPDLPTMENCMMSQNNQEHGMTCFECNPGEIISICFNRT